MSQAELAAIVRDLAAQVVGSGARRVLLVPPDQTRLHSRAGEIVAQLVGLLDGELERVDVMPALGTHRPLGPAESRLMFGDAIDPARLLHHRWRDDVTTIGELSADEVDEVLGRPLGLALPFAVNRALVDASYDLVVSVGQIVPHEVAGFGGYTKHVSIGLGGSETIQRSHFFSAVYGIEQTMGQIDAPVRQLLDLGFDRFLEQRCRVLFVLTVVEARDDGSVLRGVFSRRRRHPVLRRRRVPRGRCAVVRGQHRDGRDAVPSVRRLPRPGGVPLDVACEQGDLPHAARDGGRRRARSSSRLVSRASARTPSSTR